MTSIPGEGGESGAAAESASRMSSRPLLWFEVVAVLCIAVLPLLHSAVMWIARPDLFPEWPLTDSATMLVLQSVWIAVPVLYLMRRSRTPWSEWGLSRLRPAVDAGLVLIILMVDYMLRYLAGHVMWMLSLPDLEPRVSYAPAESGLEHVLLGLGDVANAFSEEIVMRAYLITRLTQLLSTSSAILISAVLFAAYHVYQGTYAVVFVLLLGIFYGVMFAVTRRLWPLVIAHFAFNQLAPYI